MTEFLRTLTSLTPVLVFLVLLIALDSYKLVSLPSVLTTVVFGVGSALCCLFINTLALEGVVKVLGPGGATGVMCRYVAPVIEELVKSLYVIFLIRARKIGFIVDAAIYGFAVGAGFALAENIHYLRELAGPVSLWLWVVRGFGTAVMHGSATAIFGILAKGLCDRRDSTAPGLFLPGLAAAVVLHSLYNHFLLPPVFSTALLLAVLPPLLMLVYERSERATRHWLGAGFDSDVEVLESILSGEVHDTRVGRYLESLKISFPGAVVADMLCLLRVHLELSLRAKGILMAREAGLKVTVDEDVVAGLRELRFLEKSVGKTGRLALQPFLHRSSRDLWQLTMLGK